MRLDAQPLGDDLLVTVHETRIDAASSIQFKDEMRRITEPHRGRVILDLGEVLFLDSSGLGAVVASMKQLGGGRRLELAALQPNVCKVFKLTRMDSVFAIHETTDAAVGGLARAS